MLPRRIEEHPFVEERIYRGRVSNADSYVCNNLLKFNDRGSAALSTDETTLLVNNLTTGNFDVYHISDDAPLRSLPIGSTRRYTKQCQFFEGSKLAVCGSDTNKVFLMDVSNNYIVQTLTAGDGKFIFAFFFFAETDVKNVAETEMTQTVGVTPASSRKVFIAGASGGSIHLWEKRATRAEPESQITPPVRPPAPAVDIERPGLGIREIWAMQAPSFLLVLFMTYNTWSPYLSMVMKFVPSIYLLC